MAGSSRSEREEARRTARNVGRIDRWVRVALGAGLIGVWWFAPLVWWLGLTLGLLGVALIVTGVLGSSPLYRFVGIRTRR